VLEEHTDGDGGSGGAERRCEAETLEWSCECLRLRRTWLLVRKRRVDGGLLDG
jgi:hypothetical protein